MRCLLMTLPRRRDGDADGGHGDADDPSLSGAVPLRWYKDGTRSCGLRLLDQMPHLLRS